MKELIDYLKANPVQYLASVGLDGRAKCRPFMFATEFEGRLWFCTGAQKAVSRELKSNPWLELTVSAADSSWCRISGAARFENNMQVKELCLNIPIVRQIYQTADNPILEVFCIEQGSGLIADFSGNPPRVFDLQ